MDSYKNYDGRLYGAYLDRNMSNTILFTACDRDESSGYKYIRYKVLSDSTFQTIETYLPPVSKTKVDSSKTTVN